MVFLYYYYYYYYYHHHHHHYHHHHHHHYRHSGMKFRLKKYFFSTLLPIWAIVQVTEANGVRVYCEIKPEKFATHMEFTGGSITPRGVLVRNSPVSPDTVRCYVHFLVWHLKDFTAVKIWVLIAWVMAPRSNVLVVITVSVVVVCCPRLHCRRWSHCIFLKHSCPPTLLCTVRTQKT